MHKLPRTITLVKRETNLNMDRRKFIKKSGTAAAIALLPGSLFSMNKPKFKMGYQLYSIRDEMDKDPISTLKALKKMGFEDFEVYGFDDEKGTFYGLKSVEFKHIMDDLDLSVSSGHYGFSSYLNKSDDELTAFVDRCIVGARELNSKYITWPWIAPEQRTIDNFKLMCFKLNRIGEQISKAGLGFAYHNHGFEFEEHDGENGFDIILNETDASLVKLQLDMYWVMNASHYTPQELINAHPERYVMWHLKDMDRVTKDYTELGSGSINYEDLLPKINRSGLEFYYIEQGGNFRKNSMRSATQSADYFKKNLKNLF